MEENFTPWFKEKDAQNQYVYQDGDWRKCDEDTIDRKWSSWIVTPGAKKFLDKEGYVVFGILKSE